MNISKFWRKIDTTPDHVPPEEQPKEQQNEKAQLQESKLNNHVMEQEEGVQPVPASQPNNEWIYFDCEPDLPTKG